MKIETLKETIEKIWENRDLITKKKQVIDEVIDLLDTGQIRSASFIDNTWNANTWVKKAILLYFASHNSEVIDSTICNYYDKVPLKTANWTEEQFSAAKFRFVPGAIARKGSYIGQSCVIMPSFINIGAYVGDGTLIDTWSTVGSCAQIGKKCHISGGVGIGGVLEPLQAAPVIIEDECFIGARSEIAEGVIVGKGSVISMGVFLGASTKIIDQTTGSITYGYVPPYSVVIPGVLNEQDKICSKSVAIIIKKVDDKTRSKTSINELLRGVNE